MILKGTDFFQMRMFSLYAQLFSFTFAFLLNEAQTFEKKTAHIISTFFLFKSSPYFLFQIANIDLLFSFVTVTKNVND